jgi:hypothetical protein
MGVCYVHEEGVGNLQLSSVTVVAAVVRDNGNKECDILIGIGHHDDLWFRIFFDFLRVHGIVVDSLGGSDGATARNLALDLALGNLWTPNDKVLSVVPREQTGLRLHVLNLVNFALDFGLESNLDVTWLVTRRTHLVEVHFVSRQEHREDLLGGLGSNVTHRGCENHLREGRKLEFVSADVRIVPNRET